MLPQALAQTPQEQVAIDTAVAGAVNFVELLNQFILFPLITLIASVAFLVFLWGCAQYIMGANNPSAREDGVKHITWGIVGLVIMMSAWSILSVVTATFGLDDELQRAKEGTVTNPGGSPGNSPANPGGSPGNSPANPGGSPGGGPSNPGGSPGI